jgi:hypothetical protein
MPDYANLASMKVRKARRIDSSDDGRCDFCGGEIWAEKTVDLREPAADLAGHTHPAWDVLRERGDLDEI